MKIIKNLIAQITKKNNLKWVLVFLIVLGIFVGKTYAATEWEGSLNTIGWILNLIMSFASWFWIIPATLAGKLMTNDMLYWSFLNLDASLWTLWNIMKNFANFALWFLVLFSIVKNVFSVFWENNGEWSPLNVIKKTLIAGVLIQMSWFLMWAVVDLSTIMISAVGSFPSQFIVSDTEFRWDITKSLGEIKKWTIKFDPDNKKTPIEFEPDTDFVPDPDWVNELLDSIMPNHWSVSGPLLFLWLSVFDFNNFTNYTNTQDITEWKDILLSLSLDAVVIISFTIMMCLMFLFNLFRVMILWILIPLLPIIVLLNVFWLVDKLSPWWEWVDFKSLLSPRTILSLVFKPVLMVWALSLILVILVLIKSVIAGNDTWEIELSQHWNMQIVSTQDSETKIYTSTIKSAWIFEFSMDDTKNSIADIIVYFFWLFLIYFLVKMVVEFKTWIWFVDKAMSSTFEFMENIATSLPVVPIAGWVWINALRQADIEWAMSRAVWIDVKAQEGIMENLTGGSDDKLSELKSSLNRKDFISKTKEIAASNKTTVPTLIASASFEEKLKEWNKKHSSEEIDNKDFPWS